MSNFHDLDDVFDALRGPATPAELADEANSVDLMANAHLATKGKPMHSVSRRTRFATLIAAGVLGFGGAAAASGDVDLPGNSDFGKEVAAMARALQDAEEAEEVVPEEEASEEEVLEEEVLEEETTEEETTEEETTEEETTEEETTEEETTEEDIIEEEAVPVVAEEAEVLTEGETEEALVEEKTIEQQIEEICDGVEGKNHGDWVSAVARGETDLEANPLADIEGLHVSDVARSDCGKDFEDEDEMEESDEEVEMEDEPETGDDSDSGDDEEREESGRPDHAGPKKTSDAGDAVDVDADESDDDGPGKGKGKGNGGSNGKGKGGR